MCYHNEEAKHLPSRQTDLLRKLRGRVVVKMERFASFSPTSWENTELWKTQPEEYFSCCGGPILITLDTGLEIRVGSNPELISVGILIERTEHGQVVVRYPLRDDADTYSVNALDPVYSNDTMRAFVGKRIRTFRLMRISATNAKCEARPREVGLVVVFEDGAELLLSHGLHDDSDDFSVITHEMICPKLISQLTEIPLNL